MKIILREICLAHQTILQLQDHDSLALTHGTYSYVYMTKLHFEVIKWSSDSEWHMFAPT